MKRNKPTSHSPHKMKPYGTLEGGRFGDPRAVDKGSYRMTSKKELSDECREIIENND